jgi:Domain of unknown function (DUF4150)
MPDVYANGLEISGKAVQAQTIAAFPDVCFTPPENPATPPGVPIPYPSFGIGSDTENGTATVFISGKTVNIKNKSDESRTSGTEAGCAAKKGIITSKNTGKKYFNSWSADVKFEGEPVIRFSDLATHNHASPGGNTLTWPEIITANPRHLPENESCPCCKGPMHPHQVSTVTGKRRDTIPEREFYKKQAEAAKQNVQTIKTTPESVFNLSGYRSQMPYAEYVKKMERMAAECETALEDYEKLRDPKCPNVHDPEDKDCGVHFSTEGRDPNAPDGWTKSEANKVREAWIMAEEYPTRAADLAAANALSGPAKGKAMSDIRTKENAARTSPFADKVKGQVNHMTPRVAGGCNSTGNTIPDGLVSGDCAKIEQAQTKLQKVSPLVF